MPHWDHGDRAKSVVYIHGIGNKIVAPALKLEWDHALYARDLGQTSQMAYWADIRYPEPLGSNNDLAPPIETADSADVANFGSADETVAQITSMAAYDGLDDPEAAAMFDSKFAHELIASESLVMPQAETLAVDPTAPIPGLIREPGFWLVTKLFIPDAHAYFFNRQQRQGIQDRLRTVLESAPKPVLIVAHSLGSIIAYDVLHEDRFADLHVAALLTFGSQLGVRAIQDRVRPPLEVPTPVLGGWHNYLDKNDRLPMGKLLKPFFVPHVIYDHWVDNPAPNNHDGVSYLEGGALQAAAHRAFPQESGLDASG